MYFPQMLRLPVSDTHHWKVKLKKNSGNAHNILFSYLTSFTLTYVHIKQVASSASNQSTDSRIHIQTVILKNMKSFKTQNKLKETQLQHPKEQCVCVCV